MKNKLVPSNFTVPETLETADFYIRKLMAQDVYLDYLAVMSSIDTIVKTRGGDWPTKELSFEEDLIDLAWHQREFDHRTSFAFTVLNKDQSECLGCFYFYPVGWRGEAPEGADVDVSFWVTQKAYKQGLYPKLHETIKNWLQTTWPFEQPFWTNKELPN